MSSTVRAQPRRRPRRGRRATAAVSVAAVIAVGAIVWIGVRVNGSDDISTGAAVDDPGVTHVHGLGINPVDGSLIVATHYGSFRINDDGDVAERIGVSFQDTMGFTVIGDDHFLGSGHPDVRGMRAGQPTRLGLIESTDAGETWTNLSLGGAADFHGLAYVHDQVYGWDAGTSRFMVSTDTREWETRSTVDLYAFAVDPDDADHVVAGRPDGLVADGLIESTDGGRSWTAAEGPDLVTLSWDADAGLWGADGGGAVWHRASSSWTPAGELPGAPQAFLATADALHAAVLDAEERTAIYRSTDNGRTWDLRYRDVAR